MGPEVAWLKDLLRDVADFPRPGVIFKDITPLLGDAVAFASCIDTIASQFSDAGVDKVLGIEARGFIVAAPVAIRLEAGFVPVRKPGKLPWRVQAESYQLEYGLDQLEIHEDALAPGERVLIVDDVLATGGTAAAAAALVSRVGAIAVGLACIIELSFLEGRRKLHDLEVVSLLRYE